MSSGGQHEPSMTGATINKTACAMTGKGRPPGPSRKLSLLALQARRKKKKKKKKKIQETLLVQAQPKMSPDSLPFLTKVDDSSNIYLPFINNTKGKGS